MFLVNVNSLVIKGWISVHGFEILGVVTKNNLSLNNSKSKSSLGIRRFKHPWTKRTALCSYKSAVLQLAELVLTCWRRMRFHSGSSRGKISVNVIQDTARNPFCCNETRDELTKNIKVTDLISNSHI
jgi:hypothetical protein